MCQLLTKEYIQYLWILLTINILVGPTVTGPVQDPLAVLFLNNWLYIHINRTMPQVGIDPLRQSHATYEASKPTLMSIYIFLFNFVFQTTPTLLRTPTSTTWRTITASMRTTTTAASTTITTWSLLLLQLLHTLSTRPLHIR